MKNKKKMAQNLRKRAEVRKREASLAIQLSKKLEEEGKHEEASATRLAASEDIKLADKWIKTANEMDPIEVEPQEESSTFEWAPPDEEPADEEPSDEEPSDEEPSDEEPSDEEPSDEEPSDEEPSDEEPSDEELSDEEPSDEEPSDEEPSDEEPSDEEPSDEEPSDEEPSDEEPSDEEPSDEEPSDEEPSDEEPSDEELSDEEPSDEEPSDEELSDEEPSDEEPSDEDPSDEEPSDEEPSDEEPSDEEPSDEEPSDEKPSDEELSDEEPSDEEPSNEDSKPAWLRWVPWGISLIALLLALIALLSQCNGTSDNPDNIPDDTDGVVDTTETEQPDETDAPIDVEEPFDIDAFVQAAVKIGSQFTGEDDIATNLDILSNNNKDALEDIDDDGIDVEKNLAQLYVYAADIKMMQYIANQGLDYNPNAAEDYDAKLLAADAAYKAATGKNPDGALMSLEGYDTYKSNRDAIKELIVKSGDKALLTWYTVKTEEYDVMRQQIRDTETAEAYKEEVKLELINSAGTIKLLELQLEKVADGTLKVMDDVTLEYTDSYEQFILSNYMYVIAS